MIFRRIKAHIEKENWFAVFVDFCIVVVGVFIGLQVANWNAARSEKALEATYIIRLHTEIENLEAVRAPLIREREQALVDLNQTIKRILDPNGGELNGSECSMVSTFLATTNPTDDLPLIIELLSSGRITIFTNERLEKALGNYLTTRSRARDSREGISEKIPHVPTKHADLFEIRKSLIDNLTEYTDLVDAGVSNAEVLNAFEDDIICDASAMREKQAFKNDIANMEAQYFYHVSDNRRVSAALAELHSSVDEILDLNHGKDPAP